MKQFDCSMENDYSNQITEISLIISAISMLAHGLKIVTNLRLHFYSISIKINLKIFFCLRYHYPALGPRAGVWHGPLPLTLIRERRPLPSGSGILLVNLT